MSNYVKQNFVKGQVLTAAQLNHIEDGIEKILPVIETGSEKQLVSDTDGNLMWVDTTHGYDVEEVVLLKDHIVKTGNSPVTFTGYWDENSEILFYIDDEQIYPTKITISNGMFYYDFSTESELAIMIIFIDKTTGRVAGAPGSTYINKKLTIKSVNYTYHKLNHKFLPINSIKGSGAFSSILNNNGKAKADGTNSVAANDSQALGNGSFAIGGSEAKGNFSFSAGVGTAANGYAQVVFGMHNIPDKENVSSSQTYAMIVGNGDYDEEVGDYVPSNAYTLDWQGNGTFAGTVEGTAMILKSPNGTRFQVTVGDDGTLNAAAITE